MDVYWLEQTEADVPAGTQWLSAREMQYLSRLRFAKRRTDWRLGRWTAKRALAAHLNLPTDLSALRNIEIHAVASGAPEVYLLNQPASVKISLSHRARAAICAVALEASLGCDLEKVEPRSDAFVADYFTANEQALVERELVEERPLLVTLLWSAKESALKALQEGLRLDTRCMDVSPVDCPDRHAEDGRQNPHPVSLLASVSNSWWCPLQVCYSGGRDFCGWWRYADDMVRTVVYDRPLR